MSTATVVISYGWSTPWARPQLLDLSVISRLEEVQ